LSCRTCCSFYKCAWRLSGFLKRSAEGKEGVSALHEEGTMAELENASSSTNLDSSSNSGNMLGDYVDKESLGEGGQGVVFKARHRRLGNDVVLKFLLAKYQNANSDSMLLREGQALVKLNHRNILRVFGLHEDDNGRFYLVTEYMDGGDLDAYLKRAAGPLPIEEVTNIVSQVAEGLRYIHEHNYIHRDLKPKNIFRDKSGRIVIADFGLAKNSVAAPGQTSQLSRKAVVGTPPYMAPEQWGGQADQRSDLYSLGIIIYQLLTGQLPFTGNLVQIERGHRLNAPPSLCKLNPRLTPEIEQVVLKLLEKDPEKRYQTVRDFELAWRSAIAKRTLRPLRTDSKRIHDDLENIAEDHAMSLEQGLYEGPFTLDKRLHLIGAGALTKLYALDKPVLHICVSGVLLENMVIERTPESDNAVVIQADEQVSYTLRHVTIRGGQAEGATWEDAEWQLPAGGIDFGPIPVEGPQSREVPIEVKEQCKLTAKSNVPELKVFPERLSPGPHMLQLEFQISKSFPLPPPGTHLDGLILLQGESEEKEIHITGRFEQPVAQPAPKPEPLLVEASTLPPMVWVYQFRQEAVRPLLRELGSLEEKSLVDQWEKSRGNQRLKRLVLESASALLFELVGHRTYRWFVRRLLVKKTEKDQDEEIWELILDINDPNFPTILSEHKKTLGLECRVLPDGRGTLKISKVFFLEREKGVENPFALPALVRLAPFDSVPGYQGIPAEFIEQIQKLPIKSTDTLFANVDQHRGWQIGSLSTVV
jgi:serine/threonine protein kinase